MADTPNISGMADLFKAFDNMAAFMEKNVLPNAMEAGADVFRNEAQAQLVSHGNVVSDALSEGLKVSVHISDGVVTAVLKTAGKHGYVAHWLEFTGARPHVIHGKDGKALAFADGIYKAVNHPGFRPQPFMRPAFDGMSGAAVSAVGAAIKARLAAGSGLGTPSPRIENT